MKNNGFAIVDRNEKPIVLYIAGAGRSGSTLMDLLLGNTDQAISVGEVKHFFEYYFDNKVRCGCGREIQACHFWNNVIEEAGFSSEEIEDIARDGRLDKTRYYFFSPPSMRAKKMHLANSFARLYDAIQLVSGKSILIDSSKSPTHLEILKYANLDLRVLHLIRHPLAVAYSWNKRTKIDPATGAKMEKRSIVPSILRWFVENLGVKQASKNLPYTRMYFDEFIEAPDVSLEKVLSALDIISLWSDTKKILEGQKTIVATHSVGGNPMRFSSSETFKINRADSKWAQYFPVWVLIFFSKWKKIPF